ncbi:putative integral membrane protein [Lyophyllum shimeji]|uniref:Integral membrane protein n=1 Tax=Lyophyllum shimeji TaxID=47721 RepID=A0A9P3PHF4_LYOSH|nr:putative integral membrane protein [Lyophyllum shimeji]
MRKQDNVKKLISRIDAFVFWASSARIMWCFFYEPQRLPRSYVRWIATLANLDSRVVQALRFLRDGRWSYIRGSEHHADILKKFSKELGYSPSWGDPAALPAYGAAAADAAWKTLGVRNRRGVGGLPCELVHGSVGSSLGLEASCTANSAIRGATAFLEAVAIYLPVHFLPVLLTRPQTLLKPHRVIATLLGAFRSATFLSAFVTLYWSAVCATRTLLLARLLPGISHDFWDGPLGCIFAGCLVCGSSIWIENGRRRGEMALYVLPRALRACLPDAWVRNSCKKARIAERIAFILSFSALITAAVHHPETLRGLSRWTLSFIMNGPNAGFWKRRQRVQSEPDTPVAPLTPRPRSEAQLRLESNMSFRDTSPKQNTPEARP